ncbi:DUF445 domain-containing protein [Guggenheimella bovis]
MKELLIMTLVGGFIGYITNAIAILLLFRPYEKKGPFQGMIPKRKVDIAKSIAEVVETELVNLNELSTVMANDVDFDALKDRVSMKLAEAIKEQVKVIPTTMTYPLIYRYLDNKGPELLDELLQSFLMEQRDKHLVEKLVEDKIMSYEVKDLEQLVWSISNKELNFIIILGGVLGAIIGLLQGILVMFWLK